MANRTWFTVSYDEKSGNVAFATLPDCASLCSFGDDDKYFFPEDPDTFVADSSDTKEVFDSLLRLALPAWTIDLPVINIAKVSPDWGDIFYCLITRVIYCEKDGSAICRLHLLKLIVG